MCCAVQDQSQAMQLLLTDACSQKRKPQIAMVGATVQAGLAATAADMVGACAMALSSGLTSHVLLVLALHAEV